MVAFAFQVWYTNLEYSLARGLPMSDTYLILVVDDDFSIVNIIETALKQAGYQVLTAHDGEAACHIVNTKHPHLIIMDVMMPQCNGIIATMRIRQNNNVPILMLSAKAEGSDRVLGLEAGKSLKIAMIFITNGVLYERHF